MTFAAAQDGIDASLFGAPLDLDGTLGQLELSLSSALDNMGPSVDAIRGELLGAASEIRGDADATRLSTCLNNLQLLLDLVDVVIEVVGIDREDLGSFDDALSSGLTAFERVVEKAERAEDIAMAIETHLAPALEHWPECESAIRRVADLAKAA